MKKEIKTEKFLMDKDQLEAIIKKYEICVICNKASKLAEIFGLGLGAIGLLSKSFVIGGTGLGIAGLSRIARAISNKIQEKTEKELEMLCGKNIHFIQKSKANKETKEEDYENEK